MKYIQILNEVCSGDIDSCCSDYGIAQYIYAIKQALEIIHFIVPIILIIMIAVQLIKMVTSPDDPQSKKMKSLLNKIIAAVLIFFIPFIVDLLVSLIPDSYSVASCWQSADDVVTMMNELDDEGYDPFEDNRKRVGDQFENLSDKNVQGKESEDEDSTTNSESNETGSTDNNVNNDTNNGEPGGTDNASKKVKKKRKQVVNYALKFVGNPYVYGGDSLTHGIDCSGFVQQVYKKYGYSLPRTSQEQSKEAGKKITTKNLQKGDLIFYYKKGTTRVEHVALYIGNKQVVHASNSKDGIKISTYNYRTPAIVRRIITK